MKLVIEHKEEDAFWALELDHSRARNAGDHNAEILPWAEGSPPSSPSPSSLLKGPGVHGSPSPYPFLHAPWETDTALSAAKPDVRRRGQAHLSVDEHSCQGAAPLPPTQLLKRLKCHPP